MKNVIAACALTSAFLVCGQADAAPYLYTVTGNISGMSTFDRAGGSPTFVSTLKASDSFSLTAIFDPSDYALSYGAPLRTDLNQYFGTFRAATITIGSYSYTAPANARADSMAQVWNNFTLKQWDTADYWSLSTNFRDIQGTRPVDMGAGAMTMAISFAVVDTTAKARDTALLEDLPDFSRFPSTIASLSFFIDSTQQQAIFGLNNATATLVPISAIPEPATWMLMLTGMVLTGYALRRQKVAATLSAGVAR